MDKVRFGIVGCGNMGTGHAKNFLSGKIPDGVITAVCDVNPAKFAFFKEKYGDSIGYFENFVSSYVLITCSGSRSPSL